MGTYQADFLKRKNHIKNIPGGHLPGRQNTEPERKLSGGTQGAQGNKNKNGSNTIILLSYLYGVVTGQAGGSDLCDVVDR